MVDAHSYILFLTTAVVIVLSPGPDTVLVVSRTLASGSLILQSTLALMAVAWVGCVVVLVGRFRTVLASNTTFGQLANRLAAAAFSVLPAGSRSRRSGKSDEAHAETARHRRSGTGPERNHLADRALASQRRRVLNAVD